MLPMKPCAKLQWETIRHMAILLVGIPFLVTAPMVIWSYPIGHDFDFHMHMWADALDHVKEGVWFPQWAGWANYGFGEPRFIFYPPASWMLGSFLLQIFPWQ